MLKIKPRPVLVTLFLFIVMIQKMQITQKKLLHPALTGQVDGNDIAADEKIPFVVMLRLLFDHLVFPMRKHQLDSLAAHRNGKEVAAVRGATAAIVHLVFLLSGPWVASLEGLFHLLFIVVPDADGGSGIGGIKFPCKKIMVFKKSHSRAP